MDRYRVNIIEIIVWTAIFLGLGILFGVSGAREKWKKEAIQRGVAKYNETTGEWQWTVDKTDNRTQKGE